MVNKSKRIPKLTLGTRMLLAMHSAGYTSGEMAKKLEVSRHSATGWIYGRHQPNRATLRQWADECDVDFDWLVNGTMEQTLEEEVRPANALPGLTREELARILLTQLLGDNRPRLRTEAELDLAPDEDDIYIDLTGKEAVIRHLAPTG